MSNATARLAALLGCVLVLSISGCAGHAKEGSDGRGGSAARGGTGGEGGGAGSGSTVDGGDRADEGGHGGARVDDAAGAIATCASFGAKLIPGACEECAKDPISCDCGGGKLWITLPCVGWERCLQSVDCAALCEPKGSDGEGAPDFFTAQSELQRCLAEKACQADADCPGGKCVHLEDGAEGSCRSGYADTQCASERDCFSGICAGPVDGDRYCQDGSVGQFCNGSEDCRSHICAPSGGCVPTRPRYGTFEAPLLPVDPDQCYVTALVCQDGSLAQYCASEAQCESGICPLFPGAWGTCSDGSVGQFCNSNQDCIHGTCLRQLNAQVGYCSSGALGEPCTGGDCQEGTCQAKPGEMTRCYAGAPDDPCTIASDCQSGFCVQPNRFVESPICQLGDESSFCSSDDDCLNHKCVVPPVPDQPVRGYRCTTGEAGTSCWDDDDCLSGSCTPSEPPHEAARGCAP